MSKKKKKENKKCYNSETTQLHASTNAQPIIYTVTDVSTREITVLYPWSQYDSGGWPVDMFQFARNPASCSVAERGSHKTEEKEGIHIK